MSDKPSQNSNSERKPHFERDYDDQSIVYRVADLLEELVGEIREWRKQWKDWQREC